MEQIFITLSRAMDGTPGWALAAALAETDGAFGIAVDPLLLARLIARLRSWLPRLKATTNPDYVAR